MGGLYRGKGGEYYFITCRNSLHKKTHVIALVPLVSKHELCEDIIMQIWATSKHMLRVLRAFGLYSEMGATIAIYQLTY